MDFLTTTCDVLSGSLLVVLSCGMRTVRVVASNCKSIGGSSGHHLAKGRRGQSFWRPELHDSIQIILHATTKTDLRFEFYNSLSESTDRQPQVPRPSIGQKQCIRIQIC